MLLLLIHQWRSILSWERKKGIFCVNCTLYRKFVGSLVYMTSTRPYIALFVQQVSQFLAFPVVVHCMIPLMSCSFHLILHWLWQLTTILIGWLSRQSLFYHWLVHISWWCSCFLEGQDTGNGLQVFYKGWMLCYVHYMCSDHLVLRSACWDQGFAQTNPTLVEIKVLLGLILLLQKLTRHQFLIGSKWLLIDLSASIWMLLNLFLLSSLF